MLKVYRIIDYIKLRESGKSRKDIETQAHVDESTSYTWELGYQCYLKKISLDKAIEIIQNN